MVPLTAVWTHGKLGEEDKPPEASILTRAGSPRATSAWVRLERPRGPEVLLVWRHPEIDMDALRARVVSQRASSLHGGASGVGLGYVQPSGMVRHCRTSPQVQRLDTGGRKLTTESPPRGNSVRSLAVGHAAPRETGSGAGRWARLERPSACLRPGAASPRQQAGFASVSVLAWGRQL